MSRDFNEWLANFKTSIAGYDYYVNFDKVYTNADEIKVELNILNSLIGSKNIEVDFENLIEKYPEVLQCIPILLAVRVNDIYAMDQEGSYVFHFKEFENDIDEYKMFMRKTGLFDLLENHIVNNLYDYVIGVEVGLDSNARKSRGGDLMEDLIEEFIQEAGFVYEETYFKEMKTSEIESKWGLDMSSISNQGRAEKRFDFVLKTPTTVYGVETNFYASQGSKLNETARSYKMIAQEAEAIEGFEFMWLTDGAGWRSSRNNLQETFESMDCIYSIVELEAGILSKLP